MLPASRLTTLVSFNGITGALPFAGLIADANGNLFGTTEAGGVNNDGTVFEIVNHGTAAAPNYASTPTTLVSFNGPNGLFPQAGLIAANGDLFGTTEGGATGVGTVRAVRMRPGRRPQLGARSPMTIRKVVYYSIRQKDAEPKRQSPAKYLSIIIVSTILFGALSVVLVLWQQPVAILITAH